MQRRLVKLFDTPIVADEGPGEEEGPKKAWSIVATD